MLHRYAVRLPKNFSTRCILEQYPLYLSAKRLPSAYFLEYGFSETLSETHRYTRDDRVMRKPCDSMHGIACDLTSAHACGYGG